MNSERHSTRRAWGTAWLAILLTWVVLALAVGLGAHRLREQVRDQMLRRSADLLQQVLVGEIANNLQGWGKGPMDPLDQLEVARLSWMTASNNFGTLVSRFFDAEGVQLDSIPAEGVEEYDLSEAEMVQLRAERTVGKFHAEYPMQLLSREEGPDLLLPIVEVLIPLSCSKASPVVAVAGYLLHGQEMEASFAELDRQIAQQAGWVLVVAFGLTGGVLRWTFGRVERARDQLARRTLDLQRANQELSQSARVAALGAITAHLVHGLRNPVSGLQSFVSARSEVAEAGEEAWKEAADATRRIQSLIQSVLGVLREHETDAQFEVNAEEIADTVIRRVTALAGRREVRVRRHVIASGTLDNRVSGLLVLILTNLLENAIEASPPGSEVWLRGERHPPEGTQWEVADSGPGLSPAARERVFRPQPSSKEGGSGLGLAITKQLAVAMGASVDLVSSGPEGTIFRVVVPSPSPAPGELAHSAPGMAAAPSPVPPC